MCLGPRGGHIDLVDLRYRLSNPADLCRPWLSWVGFYCLWGVDAFRTECHEAHPLKGNSVFSEREALLKCTERFGPNLVAATGINAKDLNDAMPVMANFFGLADLR